MKTKMRNMLRRTMIGAGLYLVGTAIATASLCYALKKEEDNEKLKEANRTALNIYAEGERQYSEWASEEQTDNAGKENREDNGRKNKTLESITDDIKVRDKWSKERLNGPRHKKASSSKERYFLRENEIEDYIESAHSKINPSREVDKDLVKNIIHTESKGHKYLTSKASAKGLGQILPDAWKQVEKETHYHEGVFVPEKNIEVTIKYLDWIADTMSKEYPHWENASEIRRKRLIAAAYNGGIERLKKKKYNIQLMPAETRKYVEKVVG